MGSSTCTSWNLTDEGVDLPVRAEDLLPEEEMAAGKAENTATCGMGTQALALGLGSLLRAQGTPCLQEMELWPKGPIFVIRPLYVYFIFFS